MAEHHKAHTLLLTRSVVWSIQNSSFKTRKPKLSSCCHSATTGKAVFLFFCFIFSSSVILRILLPWQLNVFCPSVRWHNRYIHLFVNLAFKRQIIFSQLLYIFKPLFGRRQNIAASRKQQPINHATQAVHCPGDTPALLITTTNEKVKLEASDKDWGTYSPSLLPLLITVSNVTTVWLETQRHIHRKTTQYERLGTGKAILLQCSLITL